MSINFTDYTLEYIVVILIGIIIFLIYHVFSKDSTYDKNIRSIATVVEELNRELFYVKKKLADTQKDLEGDFAKRMSDEEIYQEIERSVYDMVQPLYLDLKKMQENINEIDAQIESRLTALESGIKQISIPSSIHANDDEKIISLYKQGISLDTIAKELHLSKTEVEFVLKINKIKQ